MNTIIKVNMKPRPSLRELVKLAEDKVQAALALRCPEHNQTAQMKIQNGRPFLDGFCCSAFETQVKQSIEKH